MKLTTQQILEQIERLQNIQKVNAPTTQEWMNASAELKPLFVEMSYRVPVDLIDLR